MPEFRLSWGRLAARGGRRGSMKGALISTACIQTLLRETRCAAGVAAPAGGGGAGPRSEGAQRLTGPRDRLTRSRGRQRLHLYRASQGRRLDASGPASAPGQRRHLHLVKDGVCSWSKTASAPGHRRRMYWSQTAYVLVRDDVRDSPKTAHVPGQRWRVYWSKTASVPGQRGRL